MYRAGTTPQRSRRGSRSLLCAPTDAGPACRAVRRPPQSDHTWKAQLEGAAAVFGPGGNAAAQLPAIDVKSLHAKIGALTLENDFFEGALTKAGLLSAKRSFQKIVLQRMIDREHDFPIVRGLAASSVTFAARSRATQRSKIALARCSISRFGFAIRSSVSAGQGLLVARARGGVHRPWQGPQTL